MNMGGSAIAFTHQTYNLYDNVSLKHGRSFTNYNTKILQSLQHRNSNLLFFLLTLDIKFKKQAVRTNAISVIFLTLNCRFCK
jgi:hypothetical protein